MLKEAFVSFTNNFKEKTTNPFLGTYIIVWLVRNWELVYTLFNFDPDRKLNDKVLFVNMYYAQHNFLINLATNILWAFGILIATYVLLNLSRFIVNGSEKVVTPWVYKITDKSSIVLKSDHEIMRAERDELQTRLEQERESKAKLEIRIKNLEEEKNVKSIKKGAVSIDDNISTSDSNMVLKSYEMLKNGNFVEQYSNLVLSIKKNEAVSKNKVYLDAFINYGLIELDHMDYGDATKNYYRLTTLGQKVHQRILLGK